MILSKGIIDDILHTIRHLKITIPNSCEGGRGASILKFMYLRKFLTLQEAPFHFQRIAMSMVDGRCWTLIIP